MYWEGKNRGYAVASVWESGSAFAGGVAGRSLRLQRETDLFTEMEYLEAVDSKGRKALLSITDSEEILQKEAEGTGFRCYYVKKTAPGAVILVFCAGQEQPDTEEEALLFEMPES